MFETTGLGERAAATRANLVFCGETGAATTASCRTVHPLTHRQFATGRGTPALAGQSVVGGTTATRFHALAYALPHGAPVQIADAFAGTRFPMAQGATRLPAVVLTRRAQPPLDAHLPLEAATPVRA